MILDVDRLRKLEARPRLHGNGFIQLDQPAGRLHIWPFPALTAQSVSTQIHNHRFSFESWVLLGRTLDVRYEVFHTYNPAEVTHVAHEAVAREKEDTVLLPISSEATCQARRTAVRLLEAGDHYYFPPFEYHEHLPTRTTVATLMLKRREFLDYRPRVLVPIGMEPDNDFNRYQVSRDLLWQVIEDTCKQIKDHGHRL